MEIELFFKKIRDAGGRLTAVRRAMVEIFVKKQKPLSLRALTVALKQKRIEIDRTTIYRELIFLTENEIISPVNLGDGQKYYEICLHHHHHLVCTSCRTVEEVSLGECLEKFEKKFLKDKKFQVTSHALEFYGLCKKCQ